MYVSHVVLLGDSIFDNAAYVPGEPSVIEQLTAQLPDGWEATLKAIDGAVIAGVILQHADLPFDATHLVVSVGGNDALQNQSVLGQAAASVAEGLDGFSHFLGIFRKGYVEMLESILASGLPTAVCTIYDQIPGLLTCQRAGLAMLNEAILAEAGRLQLPVIDLRLICTQPDDYSDLSPIEPSARGGAKITKAIAELLAAPAGDWKRCTLRI